jgi:succinate dehydrogenase / fumarate reductase flavoprotein subunit
MLVLAEAVALGAIGRKESRGAHYRTDYPGRDDANFMKSTVAKFDPRSRHTTIDYAPIDASLILPTARTYGKKDDGAPGAKPTTTAKPTLAATTN